jgi:hypothetical protein
MVVCKEALVVELGVVITKYEDVMVAHRSVSSKVHSNKKA